jgi:hypothetical protein
MACERLSPMILQMQSKNLLVFLLAKGLDFTKSF